jgi:hypothetical protein
MKFKVGDKVSIINNNEIGFIVGSKFVKDQFNQAFEKFFVNVILLSGDKKRNIKARIVNYTKEVSPFFIHKLI